MSNFNRAIKALNDVDEALDHLADNEAYVTALQAAGLLAAELPEPDADEEEVVGWDVGYQAQRADYSTGAWSEVEVHTGQVWTETDGAIGMDINHGYFYMDTVDAKKIALALLAACEYAEKEQDNE